MSSDNDYRYIPLTLPVERVSRGRLIFSALTGNKLTTWYIFAAIVITALILGGVMGLFMVAFLWFFPVSPILRKIARTRNAIERAKSPVEASVNVAPYDGM